MTRPTLLTTLTLLTGLLPLACGDDAPPDAADGSTSADGSSTGVASADDTSSSPDPTGSSAGDLMGDDTVGADSTSSTGDGDSTGEPPPSFDGLRACLEQMVDGPALSGAAASVVLDDEIVWAAGFGVRHPDDGGVVDEHTRFRVASVTKMMTAIAALSQVDDGTLELSTPMGELLPPYGDPTHPEWTASLTSAQLLSHQGGLLDYITLDGPTDDGALADAVLGPLFAEVPFLVQPGAMWNYSNANYSVAGLAVEQAAALPYRQVVEQRVFEPLGMARSTFDGDAVDLDGNYAWGVSGPERYGATDYDNGWARPAGFAWSSAEDLGRLARFLARGDEAVLTASSHTRLMTPEVDTELFLDRMHYGLGLFHADFIPTAAGFIELPNIDHGGNLPGYTSLVHVVPELDFAVAMTGNGDALDFYPCVVAALEDLPGVDVPAPIVPETEAELTVLEDYVGDYTDPVMAVGDFSLGLGPAGLQVSFPELDALALPYEHDLTLYARDNFLLDIVGYQIQLTGIRGDDGALEYVRTRLFVGHPAGDEPLPPRRLDGARTHRLLERAREERSPRLSAIVAATRAR